MLLIVVDVLTVALLSNVSSLSIFPCFFNNARTLIQYSCRGNSATRWIINSILLLHRPGPAGRAEPLYGYRALILVVFSQCLCFPCSLIMWLHPY